ncbi:MAG: FHA domain-containing protein [Colwellia sp.]|nr:FHA domain-containing protein [Colwellia sp.]MCW9081682.1 FHA domain-containing protein [Colwellia sp.]
MAIILNLNDTAQSLNYLNAYHCIGRSATNVDTVVNAPEVSRMHAIIEWADNQWVIRDISSNGTWVNNQKLTKEVPHKLNIGDHLFLAKAKEHAFVIQDLTAPKNMLIAVEHTKNRNTECSIAITDYNLLPSEESPEIVLFYVQSKNQWYKEYIDDADGIAYPVTNQELLRFGNQSWQLKLISPTESTTHLAKAKLLAHQVKYRFNLSLDEETTELTVTTDHKKVCLSEKIHHYLTLSLARHRDEDAKKGKDELNQGWILPEVIAKELGYDVSLFNTHVCRAKKQFKDAFGSLCDGSELFERKDKRIRFAGSSYRIYKGNELIVNRGQDKVTLTVLHG